MLLNLLTLFLLSSSLLSADPVVPPPTPTPTPTPVPPPTPPESFDLREEHIYFDKSSNKCHNLLTMKQEFTLMIPRCFITWAISLATALDFAECLRYSRSGFTDLSTIPRISYTHLIESWIRNRVDFYDPCKGYIVRPGSFDFEFAFRPIVKGSKNDYLEKKYSCVDLKWDDCSKITCNGDTACQSILEPDCINKINSAWTKISSHNQKKCDLEGFKDKTVQESVAKINGEMKKVTTPEEMMTELSKGHVLISKMAYYEDLNQYNRNNVYRHSFGEFLGIISVTIVGYSTKKEEDIKFSDNYWIVRPPFGFDFRNTENKERGYIWVARGKNECLIESDVMAISTPKSTLIG